MYSISPAQWADTNNKKRKQVRGILPFSAIAPATKAKWYRPPRPIRQNTVGTSFINAKSAGELRSENTGDVAVSSDVLRNHVFLSNVEQNGCGDVYVQGNVELRACCPKPTTTEEDVTKLRRMLVMAH